MQYLAAHMQVQKPQQFARKCSRYLYAGIVFGVWFLVVSLCL